MFLTGRMSCDPQTIRLTAVNLKVYELETKTHIQVRYLLDVEKTLDNLTSRSSKKNKRIFIDSETELCLLQSGRKPL